MKAHMNVYVGNFGDYEIPDNVMQKAEAMNNGKRLTDRRTKGAKYLKRYGMALDIDAESRRLSAEMSEALFGKPKKKRA